MLDGVRGARAARSRSRPLFADGRRLVVLEDPLGAAPRRRRRSEPAVAVAGRRGVRARGRQRGRGRRSASPRTCTSSRPTARLRFDRAAAWGHAAGASPARTKVFFAPGRAARGRGSCRSAARASCAATASSSTARSTRRARARPRWRARASGGTAVPEPRPRWPTARSTSSPSATTCAAPTQLVPGFGNTMRDGLGVRAERGGVELAIIGGLVARPGARRAATRRIGVTRRAGRRRSAAPATPTRWTASTSCSTPATAVHRRHRHDRHAGRRSTRTCTGSRRRSPTRCWPAGVTTMVSQDYGPVWNLGTQPGPVCATAWAALEDVPDQRRAARARLLVARRAGRGRRCAPAAPG